MMKQTEEIKAMIHGMMDQEMENYKEAVSNGEADESSSPVVYTMLQVLLAKIEAMPKVWHSASEDVGNNESILVLNEAHCVNIEYIFRLIHAAGINN